MIRFLHWTFGFLLFLTTGYAQKAKPRQQQKAEKALTSYLDGILRSSNTIHWAYKEGNMTIDSGFAVDENGVLSVTVRFVQPDSGSYLVRFAAPVTRLTTAVEDEYYIY